MTAWARSAVNSSKTSAGTTTASVRRCEPTPTGVRSPLRNRSRTLGNCSRASRTDSVSINILKVYPIVYTLSRSRGADDDRYDETERDGEYGGSQERGMGTQGTDHRT